DAMGKSHNHTMPLLDAVATINRYDIEVVCGVILGLDTDTDATGPNLIEFIDRSNIPMLTINLLQALPKTPLWQRLAATGRLIQDTGQECADQESNVVFMRPYGAVLRDWREAIGHAYAPEAIYRRFMWNFQNTYPHRLRPPLSRARASAANLRRGLVALAKIFFRIGVRSDYRRCFWRMALPVLRSGRIDELIAMALVAHHMISFARDCLAGQERASFYADRPKAVAADPAAAG